MLNVAKGIVFTLILISAKAEVTECDGIFECLKAFFNGNIGGTKSNADVIKVFEVDPNFDGVKFVSEQDIEKVSQDLIQKTNNLLDSITKAFRFDENKTVLSFNFSTSTNWTYIESNSSNILNNESFNREISEKIKSTSPSLINNSNEHKKIYEMHERHFIKFNNGYKIDYDFENDEDSTANNTDYPIIDYLSLYEDVTPELVTDSPTTQSISNTISNGKTEDSFDWYTENEILYDTNNKTKIVSEKEKDTNRNTNFVKDKKLNEVLDNFFNESFDDPLLEYPEIDEVFPTRLPETMTTMTESYETTTEDDPGFSFLARPMEAIHLCKSRRMLSAERIIGLPFDEENYWNGQFYSHTMGGLKMADLVIEFTAKINVTSVDDNSVATKINDTTYAIKGIDASKSVRFRVESLPGEDFPFLKKVFLNGREICKERRNWRPSLIGRQDQAVLPPLVSPNNDGIYFCGRSKINFAPLVVKGEQTKHGDYPWHVALFIKNNETKNWDYSCGGTIIAGKTIITAAHCVTDKDGTSIDPSRLLVIAGKYKLFEVDPTQQPLKIKSIKVYPNYTNNHTHIENDLALLITEDYIEYGQFIQPICQWNTEQDDKEIIYQEYGTLVGWGVTENDTAAEVLQAAALRVVPDSVCIESKPSFFSRFLGNETFCAGNQNGTNGCNGDSGGALVFPIMEEDGNISWYLRGVVSLGVRKAGGLCDPQQFIVFADVVKYRRWIEDNQQL